MGPPMHVKPGAALIHHRDTEIPQRTQRRANEQKVFSVPSLRHLRLCGELAMPLPTNKHSSIHLTQNDVEGPYNGNHVSNESSADHAVERLQVDKGRRADADPVRLRGTVANYIVAELSFRSLDRDVRFPDRRLDHLPHFRSE